MVNIKNMFIRYLENAIQSIENLECILDEDAIRLNTYKEILDYYLIINNKNTKVKECPFCGNKV